MDGFRRRMRTICEHGYMLAVSAFLLWDMAYMTEAPWTFAVREMFPALCWGIAAAALVLSRLKIGTAWWLAALLGWMTAMSAFRGAQVLQAQLPDIASGAMAFLALVPSAVIVERQRLARYLRVVIACWTAGITLQACIGLWAVLTGHAVFSLRGTWYIGVNLGDNRLYMMAYVTTGAVKLGLSALLAGMGALMTRSRPGRAAYAACALLQLGCLSLTDCRTAFIAVGAALGVAALSVLWRWEKLRSRPVRWACGLAAAVMLTVGVYAALTKTLTALAPHVKQELENLTLLELPMELLPEAAAEAGGAVQHRALDAGNLFNDRQLIWNASLRLLADAPEYLATGTTTALSPMLTNLYVNAEGVRPFVHVHNIYLQTLVSWGIPGLVLLGGFLLRFLIAARRVLLRHTLPLWERMLPVIPLYVLLCDMVDCFTRLAACTPMLLFACLLMGMTMMADDREVKRCEG